ncbi:MAG: hypothetical protein EA339_10360 [Rhodobacteraceae bacterium]|nr:MAG: hypothetical protein EA339_10360 [Paracoccaceae bacterium]
MDLSPIFLLLGIGAFLALADALTSSNSDTPSAEEEDEPSQPDESEDRARPPLVEGTSGRDVIFSSGGEVVRGFAGDDTLITDGDSTLRGGAGDDTLMSIGGDAFLRGGTGEDTFIIVPLDTTGDGDLLDRNGNAVAPTVVLDFNPDEDRLVLDLRQFDLGDTGTAENPAILTGVPGPGDGGLLIRVNGIDVVQLSSYGGGNMQAALEELETDFDALEVVGAVYAFPEPAAGAPEEGDDLPPQESGDDVEPVDLSLPDGVFVSTLVENTLEVQISDVARGTVLTAQQIAAAFGAGVSAEDIQLSISTATESGFGPGGVTEVALTADGSAEIRLAGRSLMTIDAAISSFSFDGSPGEFILNASNGPEQGLSFGSALFVSPITVLGGPGTNVISLSGNNGFTFSPGTVVGGGGSNIVEFGAFFGAFYPGFAFEVGTGTNTVSTYANTTITAGAGPVEITILHDDSVLENSRPTIISGFNPETDSLTVQARSDPIAGLEFRDSDDGLIVSNDSTAQTIAVLQGFTTADLDRLSIMFVPSPSSLAA